MTDVQIWAELARLGLAFSALVAAYVGPLRWARTAAWRQDLFAIRNELWDRMEECGTLDSPAHIRVRELLNGMIRMAPILSLWSVVYFAIRLPSPASKSDTKIPKLIAEVRDPAAVAALVAAYEATAWHLIRRVFLTTFPGVLIGVTILFAGHCLRAADLVARMRGYCQSQMRNFMDELETAGQIAVPA